MLYKLLTALVGINLSVSATHIKAEKIEEGVYQINAKRHPVNRNAAEHPSLESGHPRVGNWSDSEYWNHVVKLPISNSEIDNYMYVVECVIGDYEAHLSANEWSLCVFDSTTSVSSVWSSAFDH